MPRPAPGEDAAMDHNQDSLSDAVLLLLEHAGKKRSSADRARRLAQNMPTEQTTADLHRYAAELELTAREIEECACAVAEAAQMSDG